jgi:hypothetical protein
MFTKKQGTLKASFDISLRGPTMKKKNTQISGGKIREVEIFLSLESHQRNTLPSKMESCNSIISTNGYLPLHEFSSGGEITCIKY